MDYVSIDQNSSVLWDAVPKLEALSCQGYKGIHCVEDVDVAYSRQGSKAGDEIDLRQERYYRGGVSDWGATLFYTEFLGKQPLDVVEFEKPLGMSLGALTRRLGMTVDELYDAHSPSDNWQLTGPSYADVGGHRTIGDLETVEILPFARSLLERCRTDMLQCFPELASQQRTEVWYRQALQNLGEVSLPEEERLPAFCQSWLRRELSLKTGSSLSTTSSLFESNFTENRLLTLFLTQYEELCAMYNQALLETGVEINQLNTRKGDLPFFAIFNREGRLVRDSIQYEGGLLASGEFRWRIGSDGSLDRTALSRDGVCGIVGKALILVLHVRGDGGYPLALPYRGSAYMPAAYAFERMLRKAGLYKTSFPVLRVRFRFLERLKSLNNVIRPPAYLRDLLGTQETYKAMDLAECILDRQAEAENTLEKLSTKEGREELFGKHYAVELNTLRELDSRRRQLSVSESGRMESALIWDRMKEEERMLLGRQLDWVLGLIRLRDLIFFDSRGAIKPWSLSLGGEELYGEVLNRAEIYKEDCDDA